MVFSVVPFQGVISGWAALPKALPWANLLGPFRPTTVSYRGLFRPAGVCCCVSVFGLFSPGIGVVVFRPGRRVEPFIPLVGLGGASSLQINRFHVQSLSCAMAGFRLRCHAFDTASPITSAPKRTLCFLKRCEILQGITEIYNEFSGVSKLFLRRGFIG